MSAPQAAKRSRACNTCGKPDAKWLSCSRMDRSGGEDEDRVYELRCNMYGSPNSQAEMILGAKETRDFLRKDCPHSRRPCHVNEPLHARAQQPSHIGP
eukprot:scaffold184335_cov30-Tisochrysis_lutea.AAC.3